MKPKTSKKRKGTSELTELLELAREKVKTDVVVSRNAVRDALRLSTRFRLRIPLEEKRKLCRKCFTYLVPGATSTYRVAKGRIIITCKNCGNVKRLQYRRSTKTKV